MIIDRYIEYHFRKSITYSHFAKIIETQQYTDMVTTGDGYLKHNVFLFNPNEDEIVRFKIGILLAEINIDNLYLKGKTFRDIREFVNYVYDLKKEEARKRQLLPQLNKVVNQDIKAVRSDYRATRKDRSFTGLIFGIIGLVLTGLIMYSKHSKK